jgi:hypothetical protein
LVGSLPGKKLRILKDVMLLQIVVACLYSAMEHFTFSTHTHLKKKRILTALSFFKKYPGSSSSLYNKLDSEQVMKLQILVNKEYKLKTNTANTHIITNKPITHKLHIYQLLYSFLSTWKMSHERTLHEHTKQRCIRRQSENYDNHPTRG